MNGNEMDMIPNEFVRPPFDLGHQFSLWQGFAVRAIVPSLAFSTSSAAWIWAMFNGDPWLKVALLLPVGAAGGILYSLGQAFERELEYAQKLTVVYQENLISYRNYIQNIQVNAIRAGKGSIVNVSQNGGNVETPAVTTTYEAQETYTLALDLLAMALSAQQHVKDGARITKPIAFDTVNATLERRSGVGVGHERWQSAMQLLGDGQCVRNPLKPQWGRESLMVGTVRDGAQMLDRVMVQRGYGRVNGQWMKM